LRIEFEDAFYHGSMRGQGYTLDSMRSLM
jgi:hypothetical protein